MRQPPEEDAVTEQASNVIGYRVAWISRTGVRGHGATHRDRSVPAAWVELMNREEPAMTHWVEEVRA